MSQNFPGHCESKSSSSLDRFPLQFLPIIFTLQYNHRHRTIISLGSQRDLDICISRIGRYCNDGIRAGLGNEPRTLIYPYSERSPAFSIVRARSCVLMDSRDLCPCLPTVSTSHATPLLPPSPYCPCLVPSPPSIDLPYSSHFPFLSSPSSPSNPSIQNQADRSKTSSADATNARRPENCQSNTSHCKLDTSPVGAH